MSKGHIRQRGKQSWELKFDADRDPVTGKRKIKYHSFKGTKREAQTKLAELIASVSTNVYIEPNKITVADHIRARIDQWEAAGTISARTAQRYRELCEWQIAPFIGNTQLQKLSTVDVETWHSSLKREGRKSRAGGVSPRTVLHAHRVLSHALDDAERHGVIQRNVARRQKPPKVEGGEMQILDSAGIGKVVSNLRGDELHAPGVTALFTGMRLGEILGLRWRRVDLDAKLVQVREAVEETKAHGLRFKAPKTKAGRRDISLPDIVVEALREHRRAQLELRMALGLGKAPDDALVFPDIEGNPQAPSDVSRAGG